MYQKNLIFIFIFLILLSPVLAQDEGPNVFLTLVDVVSKENIENVFVKVEVNNQISNYYLEKNENLNLNFATGSYEIKFLVNDQSTDGFDYYGKTTLIVKNNTVKAIYLYPVGSLRGFVKDKLENVIYGAVLKFECNNLFTVTYPPKTDNFGSFSLDYVPVGTCRIYGSFEGQTGMAEVNILNGNITNVDIKLDQILIKEKVYSPWYFIIALLLILLIVFIVIIINKFKGKSTKKTKTNELKEKTVGTRTDDLLKTLRSNEKKIVNFLLEQKEPVYLSKIHHKTGISKGSLFRNLKSLEQKNIVKTYNEGRVRKIKLTSWFLGR